LHFVSIVETTGSMGTYISQSTNHYNRIRRDRRNEFQHVRQSQLTVCALDGTRCADEVHVPAEDFLHSLQPKDMVKSNKKQGELSRKCFNN